MFLNEEGVDMLLVFGECSQNYKAATRFVYK